MGKNKEITPEMVTAAKQAKAEYMKKWRRNNKDKIKANTIRYWAKKAAEQAEIK